MARETENSFDNTEPYLHSPKYNRSVNESRGYSGKVLETSLNSSINKTIHTTINFKENQVSGGNTNKEHPLKSDQIHQLKKIQEQTYLTKPATHSVQSSSSTPKNNILTKLLKEKPAVIQETNYSSKYKEPFK